jgi:excinuclease UvrABC nuclease subunit
MAAKSYVLNFNGYWREPHINGLPAASGVYCVYACTNNPANNTVSLRKLLYFGEAENVRERVASHERWRDWRRALGYGEEVCFNAALISPGVERQRAEAALIYRHKPPLNTTYLYSFPFDQITIATQRRFSRGQNASHSRPCSTAFLKESRGFVCCVVRTFPG